MKNILVTGGAGFIGSNLVNFFLKKDVELWVIDNFLTSSPENIKNFLNNNKFHFFQKDLNSTNLEKILKNLRFDIIYHLASPASPKQYIRYPIETLLVNSLGTFKLLQYMKITQSKILIYTSSSEIYGNPLKHPQTEEYWGNVNPIGERSCYDEGKRFGEAICVTYRRKYNLDIRIARIFNTYGPYMEKNDGRVISNFIVQALQNKPITIYGKGEQTRSFCYISDLVGGLYLMGMKPIKGEIINLGNSNEKKIIEIACLIKKLTRSNSPFLFKPLPEDDPEKRKPSIKKAIAYLDWQPKITIENGFELTIDYFKQRFNL
jgi:nucleoside-diphosphate-sugar epimerase